MPIRSGGTANIDLRPLLPPTVADQGERPTCAAWSVTGAHEAHRGGTPAIPLAPEALWRTCFHKGQTSAEGVLVADIAEALRNLGQPTLAAWPHNLGLGDGTEDPPSGAGAPPWACAELVEIPLAHDWIEIDLEAELSVGRVVVLNIELTNEFSFPPSDGVLSLPALTAPSAGYHTVLVVGAVSARLGRYLLIKNTWGTAWALGGFAFLPMGYLESFAVEAHSIRSLTTKSLK